ncbi:SCF ubiquitin ligase complex subunit cdc4 [Linnemannia zychae]|nr:SCF ubiquitin ligase complex subunit cdc4 [Linnemannia zychae]
MQFRTPPDPSIPDDESKKRVLVDPNNYVITSILLDDADRIIVTTESKTIFVYDANTGATLYTLTGHHGGIWCSALYKATLITGGTDRTIRVWNLISGKCMNTFRIHTSTVRVAQIVAPINIHEGNPQLAPQYKPEFPIIVAGSRDSTLSVWRLPVDELNGHLAPLDRKNWLLHHLKGHTKPVRGIAGEGDLVASASYDNTARVWNSSTGELIHTLVGHENMVYEVVLDTSNHQCITGALDATIRHSSMVGLLRLKHDLLISGSVDGTVQVWNPFTAQRIHILGSHLPGKGESIQSIQHDENKVVMGFANGVQTWDIQTGQLIDEVTQGLGEFLQVVFDHRRRVIGYNTPTGPHRRTFIEIYEYKPKDKL